MNPGLLKHRLHFESQAEPTDDFGQPQDVWAPQFSAWAQVKEIKSSETFTNHEYQGAIFYRITMRYRGNVSSSMRIKYGSQVLDITAPPLVKDNRWIVLEAVYRD